MKGSERERDSLPGECRGRDKSGERKEASERGTLTYWRTQRDGQVRIAKESERLAASGHSPTGEHEWSDKSGHLKKARMRQSRGAHILETIEHTGRDKSGQEKNANRRGGTHRLENRDRATSQDRKRKQTGEGHSHTREPS